MVRLVRRFYPVTGEFHGPRWFIERDGRRYATPLFLCLSAIVFADLAFAIDSIPAAFAITRDPLIIWMGNVFALLGLRALFVLVEGLIRGTDVVVCGHVCVECLQLTLDGIRFLLVARRDAGIQRYWHGWAPSVLLKAG